MPFAICTVPLMPMRVLPGHTHEMVSQLLFGECMEVLESQADGWMKVRSRPDGYEGWSTESQADPIDEALFEGNDSSCTGSLLNEIILDGQPVHVPLGCPLKGFRNGKAAWGSRSLQYRGKLLHPGSVPVTAELVKETAFAYLNTAYLWGGRSNFGVDCSGFTQSVYRLLGFALPRDAWQQAEKGDVVGFLAMARCGDLAFFENTEGRITHVGVLLSDTEIIHASGRVRVDKIDPEGIVHATSGRRTHKLRVIKRFF